MTAPVILTIKRELDHNHTISERDARILLAFLNAQENRIKELETVVAAANALKKDEAIAKAKGES